MQFTKARLTSLGIQVQPAMDHNQRALTKLLTQVKEEFHAYSLVKKRVPFVVIRDILNGVSCIDKI